MLISLAAGPSWAQEPTLLAPQPPAETTAPQPAAAVDKVLETAKTKAAKSGKRVEIPERNTESVTLYANPDGRTLRLELSTQPVRVKNAEGKGFTPIDTTLVEEAGAIKPKAIAGSLTLSDGQDKTLLKSQAADAAAKITTPSALPKPTLKGDTATYADAYGKGRDLLVTATATGFRQQIIITERPSGPVTFKIPVVLPAGLSFSKNAQGRPVIVGKDGKTLTEVRPTLLQDATAADAYGPIDSGKVGKAAVSLDDDGKTLVFAPDAAFLADPAVTYPVTMAAVAADWWETHTGAGGLPKQGWDTFVNNKDYPESWDNFTLDRILVGKSNPNSGNVSWRSYIKFPDMPPEFRGLKVQNADLILWNHLSNDCGTSVGSGITTRRITSPWNEATMTWNTQPSVTSTGQITEFGAYSPDCTSGAASWAGKQWDLVYSIDEIVQAWSNGDPNYGVQLTAGSESDSTNWRRYRTDEAGGCRSTPLEACKGQLHPPILTVDFEAPTPPRRETVVIASPTRLGTFPEYEEAVANSVFVPELPEDDDTVELTPQVADSAASKRAGQPYFVGSDMLDLGDPAAEVDTAVPTEEGEDTLAPRVIQHEPVENATDVPLDARVQATFSEPVEEAEISVRSAQGVTVEGTLASNATKKTVTFTPEQPLRPATTYTVNVAGAIDEWDNQMTTYSWSFTTVDQAAGRWTFDEGDGRTAADSSGHDHGASLSDSAAWIAGKSGNAISNVPSQARLAASRSAAQQGKAVEVADETTATSITHAQPDGKTYKTEVSSGPVRARRGGGWVPIDTTLAEQGGKLRPKALAEDLVVELSAGGTDPFVKMSADGKSYALRWPTPLPKPTVKGSVATYADAAGTGADLVVTALPDGFRHEVVLRQRPSKPLKLRIGVEDEGLTLSEGKNGRLLLKGKDKKLVAAAAPAAAWDSAKGRPAKRGAAASDLVTKDGRTELVVEPDQAFLADAGTIYPVSVAAAVTLPGMTDVWISDYGIVGSSTYRNTTLWVGTYDDGEPLVERAFLKFDTAALANVNVSAATLSMRRTEAYGCGDAQSGIKAQRVTAAWTDTALTWENQPGITTAGEAVANDTATCGAPGTMSWNLAAMAQAWASGSANHGLMLRGVDETLDGGRPQYDRAFESFNATNKPTLNVTYTLGSTPTVAGLQISPATSAGGTVTATSLLPQLAAIVADTAGGNLTGQFEIEHDPAATGQGTGQIWTGTSSAVASGSQATASVPAGKLADGWKIRWRARAANTATSSVSAWSDWQSATVDVPNPTVGAFQVTPSQVVDGGIVATSLTPALRATVTDPASQPLRAEFEVEHDPAAPFGQGSGQIWAGGLDGVASGTQASAAVPEGKLADGWMVRWRVRAVNTATTVGSPWSDWQALTADVPDPVSEPAVGALQVTPSQQVDGTTVTYTRTPSLLAQVIDPAGKPLRAEVEIEHDPAASDDQGSGQIWTGIADNVPAGTQASITVPEDKLTDGWKLRWRARAVSTTATSAWSDWQSFTVSVPKPTATGLTITPSKVVNGATVTTTLTPALQATLTHPTGQALRAEAEIEHDPAAPDGQGSGQIWAGATDNVASGTQASAAVPAGKLADGWKVRWRLRAVAEDATSAWSSWQQITVDLVQPGEEPLAQTAGPVIRTDESFTAAAWVRWSDKDGDYTVIEQKGTQQAPFRLGNTPEHGLVFTFTSADTTDATLAGVFSGVEAPVDEWFHLASVYDEPSRSAALYLNGTQIGTAQLPSAAWNTGTPMRLGASMLGAIDEAELYQRALTSTEVAAAYGGAASRRGSLPSTDDTAKAAAPAALPTYNFKYEHIDLQGCKDTPNNDQHHLARIQEKPYLSCWSSYFYLQDFEEDSTKRMKKSATKSNIFAYLIKEFGEAIFDDDDRFRIRGTWVIHSYLGDDTGNGIVNPAGDLKPQDMKVWVRVDEMAVEDSDGNVKLSSSQLRGLNIKLRLQVQPGALWGTECKVRSGSDQTKDVSAWHAKSDAEYIVRAMRPDDPTKNNWCMFLPRIEIMDDPEKPTALWLWSQIVLDENGDDRGVRRKGNRTTDWGYQQRVPMFRCDWKKFGFQKSDVHDGGCINHWASRVFVMSKKKDTLFPEVIDHIATALNPSTNAGTWPPLRDGHDWDEPSYPPARAKFGTEKVKDIPGNWDVPESEPLVRTASENEAVQNRKYFSDRELHLDPNDTAQEQFWPRTYGTNYCKYYMPEKYLPPWQPGGIPRGAGNSCDEYPFASTVQGAAYAEGHFSVRAVNHQQNIDQGHVLRSFYAHYRVGAENQFWVSIQP
ncbi:DNRLRE domain-containing protein [Nonomuraea wenchangensis]|uniref:DNRLRE domain-containing protein n=1 Tax=Nonomuraea wenchangensis TaxID=568860 RepID=UPI00342806AB